MARRLGGRQARRRATRRDLFEYLAGLHAKGRSTRASRTRRARSLTSSLPSQGAEHGHQVRRRAAPHRGRGGGGRAVLGGGRHLGHEDGVLRAVDEAGRPPVQGRGGRPRPIGSPPTARSRRCRSTRAPGAPRGIPSGSWPRPTGSIRRARRDAGEIRARRRHELLRVREGARGPPAARDRAQGEAARRGGALPVVRLREPGRPCCSRSRRCAAPSASPTTPRCRRRSTSTTRCSPGRGELSATLFIEIADKDADQAGAGPLHGHRHRPARVDARSAGARGARDVRGGPLRRGEGKARRRPLRALRVPAGGGRAPSGRRRASLGVDHPRSAPGSAVPGRRRPSLLPGPRGLSRGAAVIAVALGC